MTPDNDTWDLPGYLLTLPRYPWFPVVTGSAIRGTIESRSKSMVVTDGDDWGVSNAPYRESLKGYGAERTFTIDRAAVPVEDGEDAIPVLEDLKWIGDDKYPAEYIKQRNEAIAQAGQATGPPAPPPPPPPPALKEGVVCNGLGTKKYMSFITLAGSIAEFCKQAVAQGGQDANSGAITRSFDQGVSQSSASLHHSIPAVSVLTRAGIADSR